jgi:diaminopimelate epimerase
MTIGFNKYQGTGNDFIIIDNFKDIFVPHDQKLISRLCDRRFGIGADGLILINNDPDLEYRMVYFNSDGFESSMCGNGGRCAADFAIKKKIAGKKHKFRAADGIHEAIAGHNIISLRMNDVKDYKIIDGNYFINTGSPHYVIFRKGLDNINVYSEGGMIRRSEEFSPEGTNVNFVEAQKDGIYVRTYERGVEDETLSCGTGVTASAIATVVAGHFGSGPVNVRTRGGNLRVEFDMRGKLISDIWLSGPATFVFEGKIEI